MKLLLDLGNTRCKYAVLDKGEVGKYGIHDYGPFGKLYGVKSLCDQYKDANGIVISSVLSERTNSLIKETLLKESAKKIFFLAPAENSFGVALAYANANANALGVDRVAALIGANEKYSGSSCVVDCGTAVTIDALDGKGNHQGGVILPGIESMRNALLSNTEIGTEDAEMEFNVFSNTTESAIHTGCISAVVGGISYVVNKMASDYDNFDQIIWTGGDAEVVQLYFPESNQVKHMQFADTLVLDGLQVVSRNI